MSPRWNPPTRPAGATRQGRSVGTGRKSASRFHATVEGLEERRLLATTAQAHTTFVIDHIGPLAAGTPSPYGGQGPDGGYTPAQIRKAYGYDSITVGGITGNGAGQTVAIVDAYDQPNIAADLASFDQQFGLPAPPSFQVVNQNGTTGSLPGVDPQHQWGVETSLDVEWVHSIAPMANIILVEANTPGDLIPTAVQTAANLPGVTAVSMSFGSGEFTGENTFDSIFTHAGVTFLAATGDTGSPGGYPAYSPNVIAVGGTTLNLNNDNSYGSETAWSGSGGGMSQVEATPSYQAGLGLTSRGIPDVSSLADPNTGVEVIDTTDFGGTGGAVIGGTSLACPTWAGLIAIVNQERVANGDQVLNTSSPTETLSKLYALPSADFHDITSGSNGGFTAGPGYDLVTGLGTPNAPQLARDLAPTNIGVTLATFNPVEGVPLSNVQVATFKDSSGTFPAGNYTAQIDWGDGNTTAGTISSLGGGVFGVVGSHTYNTFGSVTFTVTVTSAASSLIGSASETLNILDAPLTPSPVTFTGVQGTNFSGVVGNFTDGDTTDTASLFSATIDFGDGRVKAGTIASLGNGQFSVSGANNYTYQGNYPVVVTVMKQGDAAATFKINSTGQIAPAQLVGTPVSFNATAGILFSGTVASFVNPASGVPITDYTVSIDWGDGTAPTTATNGSDLQNLGTQYNVVASHAYATFGTYTVKVTISDATHFTVAGSSVVVDSTAKIADAPIQATESDFNVVEGTAFTGTVANFTTGNLLAPASNFTATINWGDGTTPTAGTITSTKASGGAFAVTGTHTYAHYAATPYTVTVTINSNGGKTASTTDKATVAASQFSVNASALTGTAGAVIAGTLATFTDAYSGVTTADFPTATITWGDGTTSSTADATNPLTITQPGGPGTPFLVNGSHTYALSGPYTTTVTVTDTAGLVSSASGTAKVADAPVFTTGVPAATVAIGTPYTGVVATFTTPNLAATPAQFLAQIDWGDGTSTAGVVAAALDSNKNVIPGAFTITGGAGHAYTGIFHYTITATAISLGGNSSSATSPITTTDAPIVGTASAVKATAGTAFNGALGTFTSFSGYTGANFTALITWGDGTTSTGNVAANGGGTFTVTGSHTFAAAGTYSPKVKVSDAAGTTGSFTATATVADAAIKATNSVALSVIQGQVFKGTLVGFTTGNTLAPASTFSAKITWGDGTATDNAGVIVGSGGQFAVVGTHTFAAASSSDTITVTITSTGGSSATGTATANVLVPLAGALATGSDNGVSSTDGITSVTNPDFQGTAQPGSTIRIYAAPASNPLAKFPVAQTLTNASGIWSVLINPLGAGSYVFTASMTDPTTGFAVQGASLPTGTAGTPLVIATTGPTVAGVSFVPATGQLNVVFQTGPASINLAGLLNANNYSLAFALGASVTPLAPTGLTAAAGPNGTVTVSLTYGRHTQAGTYVVTLNALGLTDLAGNILHETYFVTFPQTTNSPNPNYVAAIIVASNGTASAPVPYVSYAEQVAANNFNNRIRGSRVIRAAAVPQPSRFTRG